MNRLRSISLLALFALLPIVPIAALADQQAIETRAKQLLQADPQTILRIREDIQRFSAAKQAPIASDFEPDIPQQVLDIEDLFEITLQPDQRAPQIFIARFQSTAISFVDAYGNPWPIRKISNFLNGLVLIERAVTQDSSASGEAEDSAGNGTSLKDPQAGSFTMTALKHGVVGNITVYLHGLSTPITILLVAKPSMYHRAATIRVSDVGPQTSRSQLYQETGVRVGTEADVDLNNALYGVSPTGSEEMVLQGAEGKAWIKGDHLFLQTPIAVFSPEILGTSPGNGKFRAYKLPKTTTVMGTNEEGRTVTLRIARHPSAAIHEQSSFGTGGY
ncbi:DotH/IcmK family type IV secretion protein [Stutzerimonas stutzeri]|uniref:DotH/IcmK family type IV secretion protein n=1 Tax=Stutzerimonas stutzeri TaxID=316 RepID=UPI00265D0A8E|nr:DotH/IcmK family type IV secretion protein [Stutzerimonas stutzeri]MCF6783416.1 DotH/IcmK family type IV secretion protein [Stutzerimonas stutzeri]